jgi:hypothetical protein
LPEPEGLCESEIGLIVNLIAVLLRVDTPSDRQRNLLPSPSDFTACAETVVAAIGLVPRLLKGNEKGLRVIG